MTVGSISYWFWVALCLYAAYLLCFCVYKIDGKGNRTDERIYAPRIVYLAAAVASFAPIVNIVVSCLVIIIAVAACYVNQDFYFKSWLFNKPGQEEDKEKD